MNKTVTGVLAALFIIPFYAGCASTEPTATVVGGSGQTMGQAQKERYDGPRARIAVNKFTNKSVSGQGKLGQGMADMLTTALFQSNRFIVLDRTDSDAIVKEQDFGASGRVKQRTAAPIGQIEGAELMITGAVTVFKDDAGGAIGGVGVPLGGAAAIGLGGGTKNAYMAIDVKVVDVRTGRIVAATTVEGRSTDWFAGLGGAIGGVPIPLGIGGYKKTPAEKAIRVCIVKAVEYISSQTPASYYHR